MKNFALFLFATFSIALQAQMPNTLTDSDKIYGLSKFWQEVNYNYIYLDKIDREQWEADYRQLIGDVVNTEDDYEYYKLLQRFCASLKDGHTNVFFPDTIYDFLYTSHFGAYKLYFKNFDGKAIVTRTNLSKKNEIPVGTELIKVNGIETKMYLKEKIIPYISSSTAYILMDWAVGRMLQGKEGESYDLTFKLPNGELKELTVTHEEATEKEVYPERKKRELLDFEWIEDKTAYVSLNSFMDPEIDTLFTDILPELYKAKKLIIDLRYNGGGRTDVGFEILKYLTEDTLLYGSRAQSRLHIPSFKAWGVWTEAADTLNDAWATQAYYSLKDEFYHDFPYDPDTVRLDAKRIVIPTVLLFGHNTASAAEDFLIFADNQAHMYKIGEPTFGSTGQPYMFDLPGGGSARICTKKDTYPDGREFVGYGILPDIEIKETLQDYLSGSDPVLEKALEYLKGQ